MQLTAFHHSRQIAQGALGDIVPALLAIPPEGVLVFNDETGRVVDLDLRGTVQDILTRHAAPDPAPRGRGRPKLGVTAREVTLLPRHWEWLAAQPGGASAALRRLVDGARKSSVEADRIRKAREVTYQVMQALAGDLPGYEEALRALFAGDDVALAQHLAGWPEDIRAYAQRLLAGG